MEQHQGTIVVKHGHPALEFHVALRLVANGWGGVMTPKIPVDSDNGPRQGGTYQLRLDDGRWGNIIIDENETVFQTGNAPSMRIKFTGNGPLFSSTAAEKK